MLDSFAGSGTTAHAVLAMNKEDGGNRRFVLVECEDYADTITAERVRRVIKGVPNAKDAALNRVTEARSVTSSSAARCAGNPYSMDRGYRPTRSSRATSSSLRRVRSSTRAPLTARSGSFGRSRLYDVYLMYADDITVLKDMALTLPLVRNLPASDLKRLVFAPTKYVDQELLQRERVIFQQLPFEIYESADRLAP